VPHFVPHRFSRTQTHLRFQTEHTLHLLCFVGEVADDKVGVDRSIEKTRLCAFVPIAREYKYHAGRAREHLTCRFSDVEFRDLPVSNFLTTGKLSTLSGFNSAGFRPDCCAR